jgi:hypothetical protein
MIVCLAYLFIFRSDRDQKSMVVVMFSFLVIFITNISPENNKYTIAVVERFFKGGQAPKKINDKIVPIAERPDSVLTAEERKFKFAKLYLDSLGHALPAPPVYCGNGSSQFTGRFQTRDPKSKYSCTRIPA